MQYEIDHDEVESLIFALTLALGSLLTFHLVHIGKNITTVEFHIPEIFYDVSDFLNN